MPFCRIVKTITLRCCGRPLALLHEVEGQLHQVFHSTERLVCDYATNRHEITVLLPNAFDDVKMENV